MKIVCVCVFLAYLWLCAFTVLGAEESVEPPPSHDASVLGRDLYLEALRMETISLRLIDAITLTNGTVLLGFHDQADKTHYVKLGESLFGFRIARYEVASELREGENKRKVDVSAAILQRGDRVIRCPKGVRVTETIPVATLSYGQKKGLVEVAETETFHINSTEYRVKKIDMKRAEVVLLDTRVGSEQTIRKR